ncbi:MAG: ATP-binding protein [Candidatus Thermoplasmatota archaeon]|nr:ATP-binding protein [Candidatus Thermoplasmatota archaeon]
MLIEFSVENFRSIKEKATLSMLASADKKHDNNLIRTKTMGKDRLLRSSVIYGANASGKSNLILAMSVFRRMVLNSHKTQRGDFLPYQPFKPSGVGSPTKFDIIFVQDGIRYNYGFSMMADKIVEEYLYFYPHQKRAVVFERTKTTKYRFTRDEERQRIFEKNTTDNVLYLSRATQLKCDLTSPVFDWFKTKLRVIHPSDMMALVNYTAKMLHENKNSKDSILQALKIADIDIDDVEVSKKELRLGDLLSTILANNPNYDAEEMPVEGGFSFLEVTTKHGDASFSFKEESDGTVKLFGLLGPWIVGLTTGQVLVVDELDTSLHYLLAVHMIRFFHDPEQNRNGAQLVFATHNLDLLDQNLFRRDQIWFTEKKPETKCTDFYSLLEYKPRKDKDIKRGYLAGRYGALPYIGSERIVL